MIHYRSLYMWNLTGKPSRKLRLAMEGLRCLLKPLTVTELALKRFTTIYVFLFMKERKNVARVASYKKDYKGRGECPLAYSMLQYIKNVQ